MNIIETDYENKDFQHLNSLLDDEYFELFGDIVLKYAKHNKPDSLAGVVLIYIDGIPAACGGFRKFADRTAEIKRVFVRREYRRQGLATVLMERLEKIVRQKGYRKAVLETGKVMEPAIALYKTLGYGIVDNFGDFQGDELCVCMQKNFKSKG